MPNEQACVSSPAGGTNGNVGIECFCGRATFLEPPYCTMYMCACGTSYAKADNWQPRYPSVRVKDKPAPDGARFDERVACAVLVLTHLAQTTYDQHWRTNKLLTDIAKAILARGNVG